MAEIHQHTDLQVCMTCAYASNWENQLIYCGHADNADAAGERPDVAWNCTCRHWVDEQDAEEIETGE